MRRTPQEEPRAEHLLKQKPHKKGQEAWKSASLLKRKIEGLKPQSDKHYVLAWRRRATGGVAPSTPGGAWGRQCGPAQEKLGTDTLCDPELYSCVSHSRTLENAHLWDCTRMFTARLWVRAPNRKRSKYPDTLQKWLGLLISGAATEEMRVNKSKVDKHG